MFVFFNMDAQNLLPQGDFTNQNNFNCNSNNAWESSHGSPSMAIGNNAAWMWVNPNGVGEGIFTNFNFIAGHIYCISYQVVPTSNPQNNNIINHSYVNFDATTGLVCTTYSYPPPLTTIETMNQTPFLNLNVGQNNNVNFQYTPSNNFNQLWVHPTVDPIPATGNPFQAQIQVDNIQIYDITNGPTVLADGNDITQTLHYTWNLCQECDDDHCMNLHVPGASNVTYTTTDPVLNNEAGLFCLPPNSNLTHFAAHIHGNMCGQPFDIDVEIDIESNPQPITIAANGQILTAPYYVDICDTINNVSIETTGICNPQFDYSPSADDYYNDGNGSFGIPPGVSHNDFEVYIHGTNTCGEDVEYTVHINFVNCDCIDTDILLDNITCSNDPGVYNFEIHIWDPNQVALNHVVVSSSQGTISNIAQYPHPGYPQVLFVTGEISTPVVGGQILLDVSTDNNAFCPESIPANLPDCGNCHVELVSIGEIECVVPNTPFIFSIDYNYTGNATELYLIFDHFPPSNTLDFTHPYVIPISPSGHSEIEITYTGSCEDLDGMYYDVKFGSWNSECKLFGSINLGCCTIDPCQFTVEETCNNDGTATLTLYNGDNIVTSGFLWTINGDFYYQNPVTTSLQSGSIQYSVTGYYNECPIEINGEFSCCDLHVQMVQVYDPPNGSHTIFTLVDSNNMPIDPNPYFNNITWTMNGLIVASNINPYVDYENFGGFLEVDFVSKSCTQHIDFPFAWPTPPEGEHGKSLQSLSSNEVLIFPNPVNDASFTININDKKYADTQLFVSLFDVRGKVSLKQEINPTEVNEINSTSLENGIYLIIIKTGDGEFVYSNKIAIMK